MIAFLFSPLSLATSEPLNGTFALRENLPIQIRHPLGVAWATADTVAEWLVLGQQDGETVTWTVQLCSLSTPARFGAETVYPETLLRSVPSRVRVGQLTDGGVFFSGPLVEVLGEGDEDEDGNPGVSITVRIPVGEGQVFVRQKATMTYRGALSGEVLRGEVDYSAEQELFGATTWWLKVPVKQRPAGPGTFELHPIAGSSCADVAGVW